MPIAAKTRVHSFGGRKVIQFSSGTRVPIDTRLVYVVKGSRGVITVRSSFIVYDRRHWATEEHSGEFLCLYRNVRLSSDPSAYNVNINVCLSTGKRDIPLKTFYNTAENNSYIHEYFAYVLYMFAYVRILFVNKYKDIFLFVYR